MSLQVSPVDVQGKALANVLAIKGSPPIVNVTPYPGGQTRISSSDEELSDILDRWKLFSRLDPISWP